MFDTYGRYSVEVAQDRRRMLVPEVAEKQLEVAVKEKMAEHAWEKAGLTQYNRETTNEVVTRASVYILSAEEMHVINLKIKELQDELNWIKKQQSWRL